MHSTRLFRTAAVDGLLQQGLLEHSQSFRALFFDCSLLPRQATQILKVSVNVKDTTEMQTRALRHVKPCITCLTVTKPAGRLVCRQRRGKQSNVLLGLDM
jgi:hypothetical protein